MIGWLDEIEIDRGRRSEVRKRRGLEGKRVGDPGMFDCRVAVCRLIFIMVWHLGNGGRTIPMQGHFPGDAAETD